MLSGDPGSYLDYWGLESQPFENVPDPDNFYLSDSHGWALDLLEYAINEHKTAALLTGAYGTGKTTMVRVLLGRLDMDRFDVALINYPITGGQELFQRFLEQFDEAAEPASEKSKLYDQLGDVFMRNIRDGRHNLLILDEAQALPVETLFEELRLLLNYQLNDRNLVTLLLVGQDDIWATLSEMPQLSDRLAVKCRLQEFELEQTRVYIRHRMEHAGARREIFDGQAIRLIQENSKGVPRRINNLCDLALLMGFRRELDLIDATVIEKIWA